MQKDDLLKKVGANVQKIRKSKGLSQVDVVGKFEGNIDTTNISRIESGKTNPTLYTLYRLSQALGVRIEDLVAVEY